MKIHNQFTNCYSVSKTLQFKLFPMFETEENLKKFNIVSIDEEKAKQYALAKPILDNCHKAYISNMLSSFSADWEALYDALIDAQASKDTEEYNKLKTEYQKSISKHLKSSDEFKNLKPKEIIDSVVKGQNVFGGFSDDERKVLETFKGFATYFEGYRQTREKIYSFGISSSIAYRIVEENFPKFVANIKLFNSLNDEMKDKFSNELSTLLIGNTLRNVFSPKGFNEFLTQEGIDYYNTLLGGVSESETSKKQGLNELCNLAYQQGIIEKKIKFSPLYKQILSDRDSLSFLPAKFETDRELLDSVAEYAKNLFALVDNSELSKAVEEADESKIYVDKKQIAFLSQIAFDGDWAYIKSALAENKVKDSSCYNLSSINSLCEKNLLKEVYSSYITAFDNLKSLYDSISDTFDADRIESFDIIKSFLDLVQACEKILKILVAPEDSDKDNVFYSIFDEVYSVFRDNISLYNKVRNYATQKPYSTEKFKLNFECPTLSDGWDQNKEDSNNTLLFIKDGFYYIGIINAKAKTKIDESAEASEGAYKKMVYKFIPNPNQMLPKVFLSKKGLKTFGVNEYILEGYNRGIHKKGDNFDLKFCHDLIDYFKSGIAIHPDWSKFGFEFSPTETYNDTSDFYREISKQAYKISFSYVSQEQMETLVKNGNLFLFRLYNKDYSSYSKGRKNLFTMYWEEIFSEENLKEPVYKLNGQAELFYRPASVDNPFVHKKGSILISKNDANGYPVDEEMFENANSDIKNGFGIDELKRKYPDLILKTAEYDIIKDKRYSMPAFSFHVPITMNYGAETKFKKFNDAVLDTLQNNDFNIIGVDRGERNLIYVSVIDKKGNIIEQKSFNTIKNGIGSVDYHAKLNEREKARDESRKTWKSIDSIKELKQGFLSAVVKEICDMMIEYNAVVVLEDLNFGFKRGRFHIEKQVYQNFEKQLIDKLNFFADKAKENSELGSIRYAYQLTNKFESFQKLGKQTGFLFYVPASYTSKIDPKTGFVNLFTSKQLNYKSLEASKEFIKTFDNISYDSNFGFRFDFKYSNFDIYKTDYSDNWTVYSYGDNRIAHTKIEGRDSSVAINATNEFEQLFDDFGVDYSNGGDIRESIIQINDTSFYKKFLWLFKTVVQLRYEDKNNDFILSPVMADGSFFDSRNAKPYEPLDGDANGAYHIALQGLRMLSRIENGKIKPDEKNMQAYNWFEFVQSKPYKF